MEIKNILKVYNLATQQDKLDGLFWYGRAHKAAYELSTKYGAPLYVACGVIAALSPNNKWTRNVYDANTMFVKGDKGRYSTYGKNVTKALLILKAQSEGEVYSILNGRKTVAFCDNILNLERSTRVTIDGHAYNIAKGVKSALTKVPAISPTNYSKLEELYKHCARETGVHPINMQATTWVAWRRRATGQLSLF